MQKTIPLNLFVLILLLLVTVSSVGFSVYTYVIGNQPTTVAIEDEDKTDENADLYADWKTYTSEAYAVSFKYPATWEVEENSEYLESYPLTDKEGDIENVFRIYRIENFSQDLAQSMQEYKEVVEDDIHKETGSSPFMYYEATRMWGQNAYIYTQTFGDSIIFGYIFKVGTDRYDIQFKGLDKDNGSYILETLKFN